MSFLGIENVMLEIGNIAESMVCVPVERMWDILRQGEEGSTYIVELVRNAYLCGSGSPPILFAAMTSAHQLVV